MKSKLMAQLESLMSQNQALRSDHTTLTQTQSDLKQELIVSLLHANLC